MDMSLASAGSTVLALAAGLTLATAARAQSPAANVVADLLTAWDVSMICPAEVRRPGAMEREEFLVAGVDRLIAEGHRGRDLDRVNAEVPPDAMLRLIDARLADRGLALDQPRRLCPAARQLAGGKDRVFRYLEAVQ